VAKDHTKAEEMVRDNSKGEEVAKDYSKAEVMVRDNSKAGEVARDTPRQCSGGQAGGHLTQLGEGTWLADLSIMYSEETWLVDLSIM